MAGQKLMSYLALFICPVLSMAQSAPAHGNRLPRADVYGFFSPAGTGSALGVGLGVDLQLSGGFYAGADLAGESPNWTLSFGHDEPGYGLASADVSYHFPTKNRRVEPFAEIGMTLDFGHGWLRSFNDNLGANLGGGVDVWLTRHLAVRPEVRYYDTVPDNFPARNHVAIRIGLVYR